MIPFSWHKMTKKLQMRIAAPKFVGSISSMREDMRVAIGKSENARYQLHIFLLVDLQDGVIADAKYLAFGPLELFAVCELAMDLILRKTYEKAHRMSAELLEKHAIDKACPLPNSCAPFINCFLEGLDQAYQQCTDIPFVAEFVPPPLSLAASSPYAGWDDLNKEQRLSIIEDIVQKEIRPYIELDAGNIKLVDLTDNLELHIAYEGSCTTCYSATGATLHSIEQILHHKIHPGIKVIPNL